MVITNLTDAPGKKPTELDIYNKTLSPGSNLKLPANLVNQKLRALESSGLIAIGNLPPWYLTAKKKKGRPLTDEEKAKMTVTPPPAPVVKEKEHKKKPMFSSTTDEKTLPEDQLKSTKG